MNLNKILLATNAVLVIAVGVLFYLVLSGAGASSSAKITEDSSDTIAVDEGMKEFRIAYINVDSLLAHYGYFKELENSLAASKNRKQGQLQAEMEAFQREYENYMKKAQRGDFLTAASQQAAEQSLLQKQQRLQQLDAELPNQLMEEQERVFRRLNDTIITYLKLFNKDKTFQYVLGTDGGLLYVNESHNITDTVLSALNSRYNAKTEE